MPILYVENHRRFAQLVITQYLSEHQVTVAPSLAAAQEHLGRAIAEGLPYEVVVLDYDLDDGKGDALLSVLVKLMPRPRVVAANEMGHRALLHAGADAVCAKLRLNAIATFLVE